MSQPRADRPEQIGSVNLQEAFTFLDGVRASAETNMLDGGRYLQKRFGLSKQEARSILTAWMEDYS